MTEGESYFQFRRVSAADYEQFQLPAYLRDILTNPDSAILDFGCGFGQWVRGLVNAGFRDVCGADVSPEAIAHLQAKGLRVFDLNGATDFYELHAETYDFVIMSHVLEHFRKSEIIPQLERIRRLLKKNGALLIMVPNAQSFTGAYWAYEDFTHHTLFTTGSLYYVLRSAGFSDVRFLDPDCTEGLGRSGKLLRKTLLRMYRYKVEFWNWVTDSSFHRPSEMIFSYELKAMAVR